MSYIEFQNINKFYGKNQVLKDISLNIEKGQFVTLLGPSGCGKSTLLRCLSGLEEISSGRIIMDGKDITNLEPKDRNIGMVFQHYSLFPNMTVEENIAFGLKMQKKSKEEIKAKVDSAIQIVELEGKEKAYPENLSGGQQQRVALARAIVLEPKILCLDEPLSNLDAKLRVSLRSELKRLQKNLGITTLYVTHDQEEALMLSDKIAVFNNGTVEQVGTPQEIYDHSESEFVCDFIGDINKLGVKVVSQLNKEGASLDINRKAYIRLERIHFDPEPGYLKLSGEVINFDYNGITTKYHVNTCGEIVRVIKVNDGRPIYKNGDMIDMYLNPADIMQY